MALGANHNRKLLAVRILVFVVVRFDFYFYFVFVSSASSLVCGSFQIGQTFVVRRAVCVCVRTSVCVCA